MNEAIDEALRLLQLGSELDVVKAIAVLKKAQAEKQKPVAWVCEGFGKQKHNIDYDQEDVDALPVGTMLYTAPPMTPEHLPQYIATNGIKPMQGGGGGGSQPEQEPVAWRNNEFLHHEVKLKEKNT